MTPTMERLVGSDAFVVRGALSWDECDELASLAGADGYVAAPITTLTGFEMRPDIRNNTRFMTDRTDLAASLYGRIHRVLPAEVLALGPIGLNERLRFYRYAPGQYFRPHFDGSFHRPGTMERSLYTVMFYLNDSFEGGETNLLEHDVSYRPQTGDALLFLHHQQHEGAQVTAGVKLVCRTDLMFDWRKVRAAGATP